MSLFSKKLGIDLGTANTLVFVPGKGVVLNEPSVVAVSEQDNRILAVGEEAKNMIGKTPDSIVAYRPMKDGVIADYRVTEAMLRYFIDKALGRWNIWKPDVMISVPAGITSTERRAVIEAAIKAGAKNAYVVKEPILAAIGAGIPIHEAVGHMIVDIGGGTTDVAVISLGGIVSSTSVKVAGNKIDAAITDYIKKIVKAISKELREMIKAIKDVLQETPPELAADIIDQGITMTGGSSQLRNLPELVFRRTGVKAVLAKDALYCVALGTGIALEHLDTYKKSIIAKR